MKPYKFTKDNIENVMRPLIDRMNELITNTNEYNKEYSAVICNTQGLKLKNTCSGTDCSVDINRNCGKDSELVGVYHTHTGNSQSSDNFSVEDLLLALKYNFKVECLGSNNKISCAVIKDEATFDKNIILDELKKFRRIEDYSLHKFLTLNETDYENFHKTVKSDLFDYYTLQDHEKRVKWLNRK